MKARQTKLVLLIALLALGAMGRAVATPPDLTRGGLRDDKNEWHLGPIGAKGWVYCLASKEGASALARQILITHVDENGPAAGTLLVDDAITGVNGQAFTRDARKTLAGAIDDAEQEAQRGVLRLRVWRQDGERDVALTIPVMGSYGRTMPFDCPKTRRIVDRAREFLQRTPLKGDWIGYVNALGLLSTGDDSVLPAVRAFAHSVCIPGETLSIEKHVPMKCWDWSYKTLFLCEYYLLTRDEHVLPTITEYATKIAMGQSGVGTWGHTYAAIENTGAMHGHLGGYGAINQMGLTLMICLKLAEECGVDHPEVRDAIARGNDFFSYFIGKGAIPYGDHGAANEWFDDNGKSGSAAIFFDLMGNRPGARFFAEMILGSAPDGREAGHCGCFWSHLWGGIGVARGGDVALQAFFGEMNWAFTLERQPDGRMVFQGNAGEKPYNAKWDCTGARLLQLCVPRRVLYITGKTTPENDSLTRERIDKAMAAGRLGCDKQARAALELPKVLELLKDPLPPVRAMGAKLLAERNIHDVERLIGMLESKDKYERYGAAEALRHAGFGSQEAADKLIAMMQTEGDVQFQTYAMAALIHRDKSRGLLGAAKPAIPVLLRMAVRHSPDDPRRVLQHDIARALFYQGRAQPSRGLLPEYGLEGVDRALLVPAVRELLANPNGWARSTTSSWVYSQLTEAERNELWSDIYKATRHIAPSGIMFASGVRTDGLKFMAEHHIKEGLDLAAWYIRYQKNHGNKSRVPAALEAILQYGAFAKTVIPQLEEHAAWYAGQRKGGTVAPDDPAERIRAAIKTIEAMEEPPSFELIGIGTGRKRND